ncbi:hypothetical protein Pmani_001105 [Petrolisthes manimaculis]|uniref:Uncharacterized protein n=1 Tax=Petrolisthes manimaculis TaxID=1843537 RepID=A0AAE1UPQ4_9EUCA|nr:hypothetical protein Pmani_001105 [Petrolisthes manimaculis]
MKNRTDALWGVEIPALPPKPLSKPEVPMIFLVPFSYHSFHSLTQRISLLVPFPYSSHFPTRPIPLLLVPVPLLPIPFPRYSSHAPDSTPFPYYPSLCHYFSSHSPTTRPYVPTTRPYVPTTQHIPPLLNPFPHYSCHAPDRQHPIFSHVPSEREPVAMRLGGNRFGTTPWGGIKSLALAVC